MVICHYLSLVLYVQNEHDIFLRTHFKNKWFFKNKYTWSKVLTFCHVSLSRIVVRINSYDLTYIHKCIKDKEIIGMTIKSLLLSPYHFVLHYVMLCDHVTRMVRCTTKASAWQVPCSFVDMLNALLFDRTGFRFKSIC